MISAAFHSPNIIFQHSSFYAELQVIEWFKEIFGFGKDAAGILVSGGSMANFVGLNVARHAHAGGKIRKQGLGDKTYTVYGILYRLLEASKDELETLVAEQIGEGSIVERIKTRIEDEFGLKELIAEKIQLDRFVKDRLVSLRTLFSHRQIDIAQRLESTPPVYVPPEALAKVFDGLIKNAIENTPDEGRIEITVKKKNAGTQLLVRDYGVGITPENQSRIFEGFFTTQEALDYSSKKPFDFNAGGKGADLLRMRVFSERYNFKLAMVSERCRLLPKDSDICPGRISACPKCRTGQGCHRSGATSFTLYFPPAA